MSKPSIYRMMIKYAWIVFFFAFFFSPIWPQTGLATKRPSQKGMHPCEMGVSGCSRQKTRKPVQNLTGRHTYSTYTRTGRICFGISELLKLIPPPPPCQPSIFPSSFAYISFTATWWQSGPLFVTREPLESLAGKWKRTGRRKQPLPSSPSPIHLLFAWQFPFFSGFLQHYLLVVGWLAGVGWLYEAFPISRFCYMYEQTRWDPSRFSCVPQSKFLLTLIRLAGWPN